MPLWIFSKAVYEICEEKAMGEKLIHAKKTCRWYTLELPQRGDFNVYQQNYVYYKAIRKTILKHFHFQCLRHFTIGQAANQH